MPKLNATLHAAAQANRSRRCSASRAPAAPASSSLTDELVRRLRLDQGDALQIAVLSVDPTAAQDRRRAARRPHPHERDRTAAPGHASSCARSPRATPAARSPPRSPTPSPPARPPDSTSSWSRPRASARATRRSCRSSTCPLYVMTPEFGAASQLEKIDMLDFADFVAINKFDRKGAEDALRDVRKQVQRNREAFGTRRPRRCRCSAPSPRASTTTA